MTSGRPDEARVLVVAAASIAGGREAQARLIAEDRVPDSLRANELLRADTLDLDELAPGGVRGRLLARLPVGFALAAEVWRRRAEYDVVITWAERVSYPVALALVLIPRRRLRHIGLLGWPFDASSPSALKRLGKRRILPFLVRLGIDRLWVPSPRQYERVLAEWRIPAEHLVAAEWPVDTGFWRPLDRPTDTLCSVGREMRDYATLVDALRGLDIPCHIAAGTMAANPAFGTEDPRARAAGSDLPPGLTVGAMPLLELRDLYARSRVVVVPVLPTDTDNGTTSVLEAMAMGRPVIATDTEGKSGVLEDGVTCVLVPAQDPAALREAIRMLWEDPERCAQLGAAGRRRVVERHGVSQWAAAMRTAADELVA